MASPLSIAQRKRAALDRMVKHLDVDPVIQGRDVGLNDVILLERVADAVEALTEKHEKAIQKVIAASTEPGFNPVKTAVDEVPDKPKRKRTKHDD